ncbi:MAG: tetratricopeptide repeat protein [Paludibacteraceae bacterium]|nr:tetratricopeptide repeat protein [Paludibacteraceae bacterium]
MNKKRRTAILALFMLLASCFATHAQLNTDRIMAIGRNALYFQDYVLSIQYFNQVIKIKSHLAEPYFYRAIAKTNLGDHQGAEQDCSEALRRNPFLPGAYYVRGYNRRQQGMYEAAENDLTRALEFAPENKAYIINRADTRAKQQKYDDALADLDFLITREPKSADLFLNRGIVLLEKGDTASALNSIDNAISHDTQNAACWSARGLILLQQEQESEALTAISRAITLGSKWAGDYMNRGIIYYRQHNYRSALADYDQAVKLSNGDAQCYYNRGLIRFEVGDYNNALDDLDKALERNQRSAETYYQRGLTQLELRQWQSAQNDFDSIIAQYPYFVPAYYLAARAAKMSGRTKTALQYERQAYIIEQNKDRIRNSSDSIKTEVRPAKRQETIQDIRKEFSNRAAQNPDEEAGYEYDSQTRGNIQKHFSNAMIEPAIQLCYYTKPSDLRRTDYYNPIVEQYNKQKHLPNILKISSREVPLEADVISLHFERINTLSSEISHAPDDADLHFARSIEFACVQDYNSAIEDLNQAVRLRPDFVLAIFCRANLRYKLLDIQRYNNPDNGKNEKNNSAQGANPSGLQNAFDHELIMRDYDEVIRLAPDFAYALYNKANILCSIGDYEAAITIYDKVIQLTPDMAEAYFNRGLTKVYINQVKSGIDDLGKAGELGIYQAYNLITRFNK